MLAGKRLDRAITLYGKTLSGKRPTSILDEERWQEHVKVYDEKTIRTWIRKGLPLRRIAQIGRVFGVSGNIFTDETIETRKFDKIINEAKFHSENPDVPVPGPPPAEELVLKSSLNAFQMIDGPTSQKILELFNKTDMVDTVIDFLEEAMEKDDPVERHWVYITLGLTGNDRARTLAEEGLKDPDAFARSGAERALEIWRSNKGE